MRWASNGPQPWGKGAFLAYLTRIKPELTEDERALIWSYYQSEWRRKSERARARRRIPGEILRVGARRAEELRRWVTPNRRLDSERERPVAWAG